MLKNTLLASVIAILSLTAQAATPLTPFIIARDFQVTRASSSQFRLTNFFNDYSMGEVARALSTLGHPLEGRSLLRQDVWADVALALESSYSAERLTPRRQVGGALDQLIWRTERDALALRMDRIASGARRAARLSPDRYEILAQGLLTTRLEEFWRLVSGVETHHGIHFTLPPAPGSAFFPDSFSSGGAAQIRRLARFFAEERTAYSQHVRSRNVMGQSSLDEAAVRQLGYFRGWTRETSHLLRRDMPAAEIDDVMAAQARLPRWISSEHPFLTITKVLEPWTDGIAVWPLSLPEGPRHSGSLVPIISKWRRTLANEIDVELLATRTSRRPDDSQIHFHLVMSTANSTDQAALNERIRRLQESYLVAPPFQHVVFGRHSVEITGLITRSPEMRVDGWAMQEALLQAWLMPAPR